jgi:hypothetical protein
VPYTPPTPRADGLYSIGTRGWLAKAKSGEVRIYTETVPADGLASSVVYTDTNEVQWKRSRWNSQLLIALDDPDTVTA